MDDTTNTLSLKEQVNRIVAQWPKSLLYGINEAMDEFKKQFQPGEEVLGWISSEGGTAFTGNFLILTNQRLIVFTLGFKSSIYPIALEAITAIETEKKGFFGTGGEGLNIKEVARTTSVGTLKPPQFASRFITELNKAIAAAKSKSAPPTVPSPTTDPISQLEKLAELKAKGILTEEEFLAQKRKILGS